MTPVLFEDLVPDIDRVMGMKAVFGPLRSRVLCFAGRGGKVAEPKRWCQVARSTAERAMQRRWLITIAGGRGVHDGLGGRVLNFVSVSSTYGETAAFIRDEAERERLAQWPTAVAVRDVYEVDGYPHVVGDLGLDDLRVLENAFDGVVRPEDRLVELYRALRGRGVRLRDLPPLIGFRDEDRLVLTG